MCTKKNKIPKPKQLFIIIAHEDVSLMNSFKVKQKQFWRPQSLFNYSDLKKKIKTS